MFVSRRSSSRRSVTHYSPASRIRPLRCGYSGSRRPRVSAISSCTCDKGIPRRQRSPVIRPGFVSPDACPSRLLGGRNRSAHHAMVLSLRPVIAEAGLLIEAARGVVEKRSRNLLALRVLRIALHDAPAVLRDQVEGAPKRDTCDAFPSVVPVDEDARDAIVGRLIRVGCLVFLPVMDVRELVRRAVLAPGHRGVAVEDQGRMSVALANETLLPGTALFALGPADPRMEPGAPAAAEAHALVLLGETRERIPSRGIKCPDRIVAHSPLRSPALVRLTSERVYARPAWHGPACLADEEPAGIGSSDPTPAKG